MRRAFCAAVVYAWWLGALSIAASENDRLNVASSASSLPRNRRAPLGLKRPGGSPSNSPPASSSPSPPEGPSPRGSQSASAPSNARRSANKLLDRITRDRLPQAEATSEDSQQDDHSVSEDQWSHGHESADEDVVTEADLACAPSKFLSPIYTSRAISDPTELLAVFKQFSLMKNNGETNKLLFFVTAGTGEELMGNKQISQKMMMPTVHKKHKGYFNLSDGVAELSDDGRLQVEVLRDLFGRFVKKIRSLTPELRKHACIDAFFTSNLQSGMETCLEAFSGLLDELSCHSAAAAAQPQHDGYAYSSERFIVLPHLREVVESFGDVGESLAVVLKKTKALRMQTGFQRDVFNCAVAYYGLMWFKQQLGAVEAPQFAAAAPAAAAGGDEQAAATTLSSPTDAAATELLQSLDKFAYPKGAPDARRPESYQRIFSFLKESARQEPFVQRAVWATPEEMDIDFVESDASVLRRGLSLLRSVCAMQNINKLILTTHLKFVERLTKQPLDNGEMMAFTLNCDALAACLRQHGFRLWETEATGR